MPPALASHGVSMPEMPEIPQQPLREAEAGGAGAGAGVGWRQKEKERKEPAVCPTDDEAIVPRKKEPLNKRSFDYVWRSGVAGGVAGCAAKTVVAPLDRVKILFQSRNPQFLKYTGSWLGTATALRDIYQQEGPAGLYRGHSATLLRIFPYAAIKFLAYEQIRAVVIRGRDQETPLRRLVSGSLAGVTSVFFTYPLEVIRVRLAFETKRDSRSSLRSICKQIYHEHPYSGTAAPAVPAAAPQTVGQIAPAAATAVRAVAPRSGLVNFYRGFSPTLLGMLPYAGISFMTHDTAGDLLRHPSVARWTTIPRSENDFSSSSSSTAIATAAATSKPAQLRSWAELLAGGAAGLVSQTASYPLEVIRRRMQVGGAIGDGRRLRIGETAVLIFRERGLRGFFIGLTIGYVKVVPMAAAAFYTYERLKTWLGI